MDYTKFEMNNEYRTQNLIEDISFTFCIEHDKLIFNKSLLKVGGENIDTEKNIFHCKKKFWSKILLFIP